MLVWFSFRNQDIFKEDATFYIRNEVHREDTISLESVNYPGYFLAQSRGRIRIIEYENTNEFKNDASFTSESNSFKM